AGLIEAVRPLLEALQAAGLHIGKELAMQVLHLAGE
ncbi:MAG: DUF3368 domain-containing protein, partial [Chloroflexi bacterium]|nr:DUF3368 domain-containing protein [Chloroflexota bacterium]